MASSGTKGFDFGSDDILCSYEDFGNGSNHDSSTASAIHSDPVITSNSAKDFHKSRMARSSMFPATSYSHPEDSFAQDVITSVEKSMKKHTDSLMRFLEGISSRLSQLELYSYNLDKSIGEMRSEIVRDHGDADSKLKSLDKHLQEVQRSVQILRDKQELAETQKELAKLHLVHKESSSSSHSQSNEEKGAPSASDQKNSDSTSELHNQQLALALPHQIIHQQPPPILPAPPQTPAQNVTHPSPYYIPPSQLPAQGSHPQAQYLPSDPQYRAAQVQDLSRVPHTQGIQTPAAQQFSQYQQQWPQQVPQQIQPQQQQLMQPQVRPSSTTVHPSYNPPVQPSNLSPSDALPKSMPAQVPFSAIPQPLTSRMDALPYGYTAARGVPQHPSPSPQQLKGAFGTQTGDVYAAQGPHPTLPTSTAYMMYDNEGGRAHHPSQQQHFQQGGYPSANLSLQNPQTAAPSSNMLSCNPSHSHLPRNHPYTELIDRLVSMGFRGDHVVSAIQRMEESGQPVDFNAVLDRLNMHPTQRGW